MICQFRLFKIQHIYIYVYVILFAFHKSIKTPLIKHVVAEDYDGVIFFSNCMSNKWCLDRLTFYKSIETHLLNSC